MVTVQQALELALQHHQAGRLVEAEALYRQILAVQADHVDALHLLGVIAHQSGRQEMAEGLIQRTLALAPNSPQAHANLAAVYCVRGQPDKAIASYRRSIQLQPDDAQTHHSLGNVLRSVGRSDEAIAAFRRALQLKPDAAETENSLGVTLAERRQFDEAIAAFRRALQLNPCYAEACNNLGIVLGESERLDESVAVLRRALDFKADDANTHNNLGNALAVQSRYDEALAAYQRALVLDPAKPEAYNNLGNALREIGRLEEGLAAYRRALQLKQNFPDAYNNLGIALARLGRLDEAIASYSHAVRLNPALADAHNNLGIALAEQGRSDEALAAYHRALEINPSGAQIYNNLGNALKDRGELDEAIATCRQALELRARNAGASSNLIYTMHFHPGLEEEAIAREERRWNQLFSVPVRSLIRPFANDREPERRLRIGYVSADFRDHVVGRNVTPLFKGHDRDQFEILCYAGVICPDNMTEEFRKRAGQWRSTVGMGDEALAEMIRRDKVDILVDLAQHTAENRLPVFARESAPVQVSFAGYPASAGVDAIRHRISDAYLELRGGSFPGREQLHLIDSFWCYNPCGMHLEVAELPTQKNGWVTFGSLNNFCKVNEPLLKLWARVLREVNESRLVMLSGFGSHRQRTLEFLEREGVPSSRVEFVEPRPRKGYLELYHRLDIALDTFPYNGHTTSLDALWMGVPVVSLAGQSAVSRAGLSQLSNLGLPELVAQAEDEFVEIATRLARDVPRLAELRRTLRARMEASVLMDAPRFARNIETAYRAMWLRWCAETEP